jgi:microcompartment protein CcmK/EutM
LKLAKVVGNVVSTVRCKPHEGYKLMLVRFLDEEGRPSGPRSVAFDCVNSGIGDLVIVNMEGGAARILMEDDSLAANVTVCGVVDFYVFDSDVYGVAGKG